MRITLSFHKPHIRIKKLKMPPPAIPLSPAESITNEIIQLFEQYGAEDYDGEPVSQTSHMIQCAMLAMDNWSDMTLILGALLHDIGHLLKHKSPTQLMDGYGVLNHESIGAAYLRSKGFPERICAVVEQHVAAKRYLVATDAAYQSKLSPASVQTLQWQGGPMSPEEAWAFEKHPFFTDIIKVRRWDEEAKGSQAVLLPLSYYRKLLHDYLTTLYT
jgi:phosphonate degradation associated HDIG domain protein